MNELEEQLSKILEKAIEIAEQTGEFVIEQAPLLLQEFYAWHIAKYSLGLLLGVVILIAGMVILKSKGKKESFKKHGDKSFKFLGKHYHEFNGMPNVMAFCISVVLFIVIACINIYNIAFILIAPKLYLIEHFTK